MSKVWKPTLFGTLATIILFPIGGLFSAGGHNLALMMVFFPWAMTLAELFSAFAWWLPFVLLVALQFPFYGIFVGLESEGRSFSWRMVGLVGYTCWGSFGVLYST